MHLAQGGKEQEQRLVEKTEDSNHHDDDEPDPYHQVDLLVDHVDGEGAHAGVVDWVATWAKIDHRALDDFGKDFVKALAEKL